MQIMINIVNFLSTAGFNLFPALLPVSELGVTKIRDTSLSIRNPLPNPTSGDKSIKIIRETSIVFRWSYSGNVEHLVHSRRDNVYAPIVLPVLIFVKALV